MSPNKHTVENEGSKPRDHDHSPQPFWKHAHRDWRVWVAVVLMLVAILTYVMTNNLSLGPGKHAVEPTPEIIAP